MIAVLEDDARRWDAMAPVFARDVPDHEVVHFDNAPDMIDWLGGSLTHVRLVCLDHDLGPSRVRGGEAFEPSSGRDVVDFLAEREPVCPVLLHTSNYRAAPGMIGALEASHWRVDRIVPAWDLQWIDTTWADAVRRLAPSA